MRFVLVMVATVIGGVALGSVIAEHRPALERVGLMGPVFGETVVPRRPRPPKKYRERIAPEGCVLGVRDFICGAE